MGKVVDSFFAVLIVVGLFPSALLFVFSIASSIVIISSVQASCPNILQAYVIGCSVFGYAFSFFYGLMLVSPRVRPFVWVIVFALWNIIAVAYTIFGSVALGQSNSSCSGSSLYKMGVGLQVVYYFTTCSCVVFATAYGLHLCLSRSLPSPNDALQGSEPPPLKDQVSPE